MKSYLMIFTLLMTVSCNPSEKLSYWDKTCLEEPFQLLMVTNGLSVPAYEGFKRNKVFIWDESDSLMSKLKELESSSKYKEGRNKIFQTGNGDIVRVENSVGDKARDLIRSSSFYKACVNFYDVSMKQCPNCKKSPTIYFRWNVTDFSNSSGSSVVDFRKFKDHPIKFE